MLVNFAKLVSAPVLFGVAVGGEPQIVDHRVDVALSRYLAARLHLNHRVRSPLVTAVATSAIAQPG